MPLIAAWLLFAMRAVLEAGPPGQRLYRHRARDVEGLTAWLRKQSHPLRWAVIVTAISVTAHDRRGVDGCAGESPVQ